MRHEPRRSGQKRDALHRLGEAVERDARVEVVHVVVADVPGEPAHDGPGLHVARGVERGVGVLPLVSRLHVHLGEVVLRVEEVRAGRGRHEERQEVREEEDLEAERPPERDGEGQVHDHRERRVPVLLRVPEERAEAHAVEEDGKVAEQDGQRVADQLVHEPLLPAQLRPHLGGDHEVAAHVRAHDLRGVRVVVVVGLAPDLRRGQHEHAVGEHHPLGDLGAAQQRVVHEVVIEDERAHDHEPVEERDGQADPPLRRDGGQRGQPGDHAEGLQHVEPAARLALLLEGLARGNELSS